MAYDVRVFVGDHSPKLGDVIDMYEEGVDYNNAAEFNKATARFERMVVFDSINTTELPFVVYELRGEPVAWYDIDNLVGIVI